MAKPAPFTTHTNIKTYSYLHN